MAGPDAPPCWLYMDIRPPGPKRRRKPPPRGSSLLALAVSLTLVLAKLWLRHHGWYR